MKVNRHSKGGEKGQAVNLPSTLERSDFYRWTNVRMMILSSNRFSSKGLWIPFTALPPGLRFLLLTAGRGRRPGVIRFLVTWFLPLEISSPGQ